MPPSLIPLILFLFFGALFCAPENLRNENAVRLKMHKAINEKGDPSWEEYKLAYDKKYASVDDEQLHRDAFEGNKAKIQVHNAAFARGECNFTLGFSHLTDWTSEERQMLNGYRPNKAATNRKMAFNDDADSMVVEFIVPKNIDLAMLNATVDWRNGNGSIELVTSVKNQRFCRSCWAFATVGAFEAAHAKATGKLVSLSEQNLLDCDNVEDGCAGAHDMENPFKFVLNQGYLDTENAYPYVAKKRSCKSAKFGKRAQVSMTMVHKIHKIEAGDEQALKAAVALHGPVLVTIAANDAFIGFHGDTIFDECNDEESHNKFKLNHAILLVGYGTDENGADYWLIKNSFGEFWGNEGYGKIARNRDNKCGIAWVAMFVE